MLGWEAGQGVRIPAGGFAFAVGSSRRKVSRMAALSGCVFVGVWPMLVMMVRYSQLEPQQMP